MNDGIKNYFFFHFYLGTYIIFYYYFPSSLTGQVVIVLLIGAGFRQEERVVRTFGIEGFLGRVDQFEYLEDHRHVSLVIPSLCRRLRRRADQWQTPASSNYARAQADN